MLQDIRKNAQGTGAKILVGLIVIAFAGFGVESILLGGGGNAIAEVNGEDITPQQLQQSIDTQKRRLFTMMGDNVDPAMLEDARLRGPALEALISRTLAMQTAQELGLAVSEREIGSVVADMAQFQVEGKFSPEVYKNVLANAGYTPAYFKQSLRDDLILNQLSSGLAGSEFATPDELALNARIVSEQRDLRYLTIPQDKFTATEAPSEAELEAWYADHESSFMTAESVDLDYIELGIDDFRQPVEEVALQEAYEFELEGAEFSVQNRVSHILFLDGGEIPLEERLAAAGEELAAGVSFAEVAAAFSEDAGSATQGGDLGYSAGEAFPEAMEEAIAALEIGMVSEPVETEAGTHLILVTERKPGEKPTLEEMRPGLEDRLQRESARAELLRTVELLRDLSFNSEDLEAPATELQLKVARAEGIARTQGEGLFASPILLEAAFSEEVLVAGHNSEVIEVGQEKFVLLRVRSHNEPRLQALSEVREQVVDSVVQHRRQQAVTAQAAATLAQLQAGESLESLAVAGGYEWQVELGADRRNTNVAPDILRRAFELSAPAEGSVSADFIFTPGGDAVVVQLERVTEGSLEAMSAAQREQLQRALSSESGSLVNSEFQQGLRVGADITVL